MREGRPSGTALDVARGVLFWNEDPEIAKLIPPGMAEACRWFVDELHASIPRNRSAAILIERVLLPGISIHYLVRKRWIEEKLREALAEDYNEVTILAGGFDTLALRLHREFPDVQFTEIDHPATQAVKRRVLERHAVIGKNLILKPYVIPSESEGSGRKGGPHTSRSLADARDDKNTFWIAEGLLMYLDEEAVIDVFRDIASKSQGRFLFSFVATSEFYVNAVRRAFVNVGLHLRGEPLRWHIDQQLIESWLQQIGFRSLDRITPAQLRASYVPPEIDRRLNPPSGDVLCLSEW